MTSKTRKQHKKVAVRKPLSLEKKIKWTLLLFGLTLFILTLWIMSLLSLSVLMQFTVIIFVFFPLTVLCSLLYKQLISPFYSLTNLVEAVRLEDYSLRINDKYQSGILHDLSQEITLLSEDLQKRKQAYDQHTLLIYHLIEQLEAPIAIFNNQHQLSHANEAFSKYIEQPWQSKRLMLSDRLGLTYSNGWHFKDEALNSRWQIKYSQFVEHEKTYHLVILTDVEELLKVNQQKSWQQIIRVLSHEIRNSLTPIKSLAQTLVSLESEESKSKQVLQVIVDRSTSLQAFVNRYGDISKNIQVNKSWIDTQSFIEGLLVLFPQSDIRVKNKVQRVWGDPVLLNQVLINLIKNAEQAGGEGKKTNIELMLSSTYINNQAKVLIEVIDDGQGIANLENLFVPFYTTKKQGQGIGLSLCQNIIDQHGGRLSLVNNKNKVGATAKILLPAD